MENIAKSECGRVHGPNWLKWVGHLKGKANIRGLELGTFQGDSAQWFLDNIFTDPSSGYTCVDIFTGSVEHAIAQIDCTSNEAITREKLKNYRNVQIFKMYSNLYFASTFYTDQFDFIYIDAAHDAMNVLRDAVLSFEALKPGGTIVFDDYTWRVMPREIDNPRIAIDAFAACYADSIEFLGKGSQYAIRKLNK